MGLLPGVGSLSPGASRQIEDPAKSKLKPSPRWYASIHRQRLYQALMLGGHHVLAPRLGACSALSGEGLPDQSYLLRLRGEISHDKAGLDVWDLRRQRSAHDPVAARIIWVYVDFLFRQQIDRTAVATVLGQDLMADVDGRGTDAEDWLSQGYACGLAQGWVAAQVDMPQTPDQGYSSALHEAAAGLQPALRLLLPERFWDIEVDDRGLIQRAVVQESDTRLRIWQDDWSQPITRKGEALGPRVTHFSERPPFELFTADDPDPLDPLAPLGESAMRATALIDLQILQHASLLDDVVRKSGFPFLHVRRDPIDGAAEDIYLGTDYVYPVDADVSWVAPPRDLIEALWLHLDHLESTALKVGGVHRRSQESVEAHSGLALDWESSPIYATIHRWARRCREWETRIWRLMAVAIGKDPATISVTYPDDYSTRPAESDMDAAAKLLAAWPSDPPEWVRVVAAALQRRAARRIIGSDRDVAKALLEPLVPVPEPEVEDAELEDVEVEEPVDEKGVTSDPAAR